MRTERLFNLLSPGRLLRCRQLFRAPFAAHLRLAGLGRGPFTLELRRGGSLTRPSYRTVRRMWSFLLALPPGDLSFGEGVLTLRHEGLELTLRPDNSDFGVFEEVWLRDAYGLGGLGPLDTVVDVGGNVGLFSARAARQARRVVMVEPVEGNLAVARRNLSGAGVADRVAVVPQVVTARTGERVRLHLSSIAGMSSLRADVASVYAATTGALEVEGVSLGDLFERHGVGRCDLLKCDIEGGEHEALGKAPDDVLRRIDRLAMELHLTPADADAGRALVARLEGAGLSVEVLEGTLEPPREGLSVALVRARRA